MPRKYTKIHRKKRGLRKTMKHRRNKRGGYWFKSNLKEETKEEIIRNIDELNYLILKNYFEFSFDYYIKNKNLNNIFEEYNPTEKYKILQSDYKQLYNNYKKSASIYINNNKKRIQDDIKKIIVDKNKELSNAEIDEIFEMIQNNIQKNYKNILFKYFKCIDSDSKQEVNCRGW